MNSPYFTRHLITPLIASISLFSVAMAQTTAFTYQGRLDNGGVPVSGIYDLQFRLYDNSSAGSQLSSTLTSSAMVITNGLLTLTLDFGNQFPGANRWLAISVRTNGGGSYSTLSPRQQITSSPYAITAANVTGAILFSQLPSNILTNNSTGVNLTGTFTGNGGGLTNINAVSLGGLSASSYWRLTGNGSTTPGANFLGTTDNQALEFKANNSRVSRFEPNATSPNIVGGHPENFVTNGIYGATVAGGGDFFAPNRVGGNYGSVLGGRGNVASGNSSVAMGISSIAMGEASVSMGSHNSTPGNGSAAFGLLNTASGQNSLVAGSDCGVNGSDTFVVGFDCNANGDRSAAIGSITRADGFASIATGSSTTASGDYSTAMGRRVEATNSGTFVWGDNTTDIFRSTSSNQFLIRASGGVGINTNDPAGYALSVNGNVAMSSSTSTLQFVTPSVSSPSMINMFSSGTANLDRMVIAHSPAYQNWGLQYKDVGDQFVFLGSGSARIAINLNPSATGVVGIGTTTPTNTLHVAGGVSATAFVTTSDRNAKENFKPVAPLEVLNKVAALPISTWNFKTMNDGAHMGPMAQDFYAAFGLGGGDTTITSVDPDGVALAAIQGLNQKLEETRSENAALKARLEKIEALLVHQLNISK